MRLIIDIIYMKVVVTISFMSDCHPFKHRCHHLKQKIDCHQLKQESDHNHLMHESDRHHFMHECDCHHLIRRSHSYHLMYKIITNTSTDVTIS